jgi:hypothetical protein
MKNYFILSLSLTFFLLLSSCGKKDEENKSSIQIIADKEKELNDREARNKLKEIELDEREKKLNGIDNSLTGDTSSRVSDTSVVKQEKKSDKKKEIQKEMSRKFENPVNAVKDYFEYIQRAVNETGNFDANISKAHKLFPSRSVDKLKGSYRKTRQFVVLEEPKVVANKDDKSTVSAKVKQVDLVTKDGKEQEVSKTIAVTYSLTANDLGQWVISSAQVKSQ